MVVVTLCQSDLESSYENSMTFKNRYEQFDYIQGNIFKKVILNIPKDSHRQEFEVDIPITEMKKYDYCIIGDDPETCYYYFILGVTQKGTLTNVYVQIDLIQSYIFDWEIRESFIDRMHVDRWQENGLPTPNYEDEGLDYGYSIANEVEKIQNIPLNFIICATTPIGKIDTSNGEGGGGETNPPSDIGAKIVNTARKLIGKPYVWGGNYPPLGTDVGTDCSGLCQWAYHQNGKKITRTTYTQIKEGKEVSHNEIKPADLVFMNFKNGQPEHVVLYSGTANGKKMCVEAPQTGMKIRERELSLTSSMVVRRLL